MARRCRQPPPRPRTDLRRGSCVEKINIWFAGAGVGVPCPLWGPWWGCGAGPGVGLKSRVGRCWQLPAAGSLVKAAGRPCQLGRAGADVRRRTPCARSGCAKVRGAAVRRGVRQRPPRHRHMCCATARQRDWVSRRRQPAMGKADGARKSLLPRGRGAALGCGSELGSCTVHPKTLSIPLLLPS